jgi:hypothetical protein
MSRFFGRSKRNPRPGPEQDRVLERGVDPAAEPHALRHERQVLQQQHRLVLGAPLRIERERDRNLLVEELRLDPALAAAGQPVVEVVEKHRTASG